MWNTSRNAVDTQSRKFVRNAIKCFCSTFMIGVSTQMKTVSETSKPTPCMRDRITTAVVPPPISDLPFLLSNLSITLFACKLVFNTNEYSACFCHHSIIPAQKRILLLKLYWVESSQRIYTPKTSQVFYLCPKSLVCPFVWELYGVLLPLLSVI